MARSLENFTPEEIQEMAATYDSLLQNPATREVTLRATKKLNPALTVPEIDMKDAARAAFGDVDKRISSLEDGIRQRDAENRVLRERATLSEQGFSRDEIAAVEKVMMDEKIPSYETAAKYFRNSQRVAEPAPYSGGHGSRTYSLPENALAAAMKGGKKSLDAWARNEANTAYDEIRSGQIKLH